MDRSLVSVIVTTYNRERNIKKCIESVINQSYKNLEIIIIDDCSTDGTFEFLCSLNDRRIRVEKNSVNKGSNASRNIGLKLARGTYIAFLDDDDEWYPNKISEQINVIHRRNAGLVYCGHDVFVRGKFFNTIKPVFRGDVQQQLLKYNIIGSPTPLMNRDAVIKVGGYDESLFSCQDWDLWIRMAEIIEIDFVNQILARYNIHGSQKSTDFAKMIKSREYLFSKYQNRMPRETVALHQLSISNLYAIANNRKMAEEMLIKSLKSCIFFPNVGLFFCSLVSYKLYTALLKKYWFTYENDILIVG